MKITGVKLSILESSIEDRIFGLHNVPGMTRIRWTHNVARTRPGYVEVLHVQTDEGIEGVCTAQGVAGDAAASPLKDALEQLRELMVGENPLDRERPSLIVRAHDNPGALLHPDGIRRLHQCPVRGAV